MYLRHDTWETFGERLWKDCQACKLNTRGCHWIIADGGKLGKQIRDD